MRRAEAIAIAVVALVALGAAVAGVDARATYGARVTADEPQYLLTAQSIADDGSLDISDEIAARAYLPYHEITIDRQTSVLADGREVSPHDPLLPVVLAAPMAAGGWVLAKLTLAVFASLTAAVTAWVAMRRWSIRAPVAGVVIGGAFAGLPLAGYGSQVYPEMPAALATVVAVAAITSPHPSRRHAVLAGAAIVVMPWLAVKYVPVAAALALGLLAALPDRRSRGGAIASLAVAGAAYLGLHRWWYGGWTVYSTGDHFEQTGEFSVVGTRVDLLGRSRRLVGLLVDRDFGLAAWSPLWLLLPPALALAMRRRAPWWWLLVAAVLAGWLNATFVALTMHGWWVPGRQLVVVLPLASIAIALLCDRMANGRPAVLASVALLGSVGAVNWVWLAIEASTGRRTVVVDFMETAAVPYRLVRPLLPSGLRADAVDTVLLVVWAVAVLGAVAAVLRRRDVSSPTP